MDVLMQIETLAAQLGASPWLLLLVLGLTVVDGVLPPIPSETVIITSAILAVVGDGPHLLALVLAAAIGAFLGDVLAFTLGRWLPVHRLPGLRGARGARALARAGEALERRGTTMVITGRFIPIGRVAINASAGALGFPRSRFLVAAAIAAPLWAIYNVLIAIGAQSLLGGSALLSVGLGIVAGLLTGVAIEAALRRVGVAPPAEAPVEDEARVPVHC